VTERVLVDRSDGVPSEWTLAELEAEFQALSQIVVRLGSVDWADVVRLDETPAAGVTRVTTLITASGMLGSLATAAMVTLDEFVTAIVAATLEGSGVGAEGATA
jgi:hypothetical protein